MSSRPRTESLPPGAHPVRLRALLVVCLALFVTTDDRWVASVADGRQMIFTAVAMTESGTLGQARGRDLAVARPAGYSVTRFGLGMTFAQLPGIDAFMMLH